MEKEGVLLKGLQQRATKGKGKGKSVQKLAREEIQRALAPCDAVNRIRQKIKRWKLAIPICQAAINIQESMRII
eukprot:4734176-Karenia_brevis.AAC.1